MVARLIPIEALQQSLERAAFPDRLRQQLPYRVLVVATLEARGELRRVLTTVGERHELSLLGLVGDRAQQRVAEDLHDLLETRAHEAHRRLRTPWILRVSGPRRLPIVVACG